MIEKEAEKGFGVRPGSDLSSATVSLRLRVYTASVILAYLFHMVVRIKIALSKVSDKVSGT